MTQDKILNLLDSNPNMNSYTISITDRGVGRQQEMTYEMLTEMAINLMDLMSTLNKPKRDTQKDLFIGSQELNHKMG